MGGQGKNRENTGNLKMQFEWVPWVGKSSFTTTKKKEKKKKKKKKRGGGGGWKGFSHAEMGGGTIMF